MTRSAPGDDLAGHRDRARSPARWRRGSAGTLRRIVAPGGERRCRSAALLALIAAAERRRRRDRCFVAGFAGARGDRGGACPRTRRRAGPARARRRGGRQIAMPELGCGRRRWCCCPRFRRRPQHLDVHPASAGRTAPGVSRSTCPGTAGRAKTSATAIAATLLAEAAAVRCSTRSASSAPTWSATRWAARSPWPSPRAIPAGSWLADADRPGRVRRRRSTRTSCGASPARRRGASCGRWWACCSPTTAW